MNAQRTASNASAALGRLRGIAGVAVLAGAVILAVAADAAPLTKTKQGAVGTAAGAVRSAAPAGGAVGVALYDNTGSASPDYYGGQGGHEAIDDLHLVRGGSLDLLVFECNDPSSSGSYSATVRIYGNPAGLDLGATPLIATYAVAGIPTGRQVVSVPLPDTPTVSKDVWVGVQFSSATAGLIINSTPTVGSSHDRYLEDGGFYDFGGNPRANFALQLVDIPFYTLNVTITGSGTVTKSPDQPTYLGSSSVQLTPHPAAHQHFAGWGGDASGADNPLSLVMDSDKAVTATFAIDQYTLRYQTGPNGTINGSAVQTVDYGGNGTTVTAIPDPTYHFVSWSDGVLTAARTDLNVTANLDVTASFALDTFTLSYTAGPGGTISGVATQIVGSGGNGTTVTAQPNTGYHFTSWGDGVLTASRTDLNVTANLSVTANFAIDTHTLSYAAGPGGTISGAASQTVNYGANGTLVTATPNTGFHFVSWGDGVLTAARTDLNVTADINVTASFAINTYTLTYTAGPGGTLSGVTSQPVTHGGNGTTVTAQPNAGYHFVSWSDGVLTAARTDLNVTANINVTATFAPDYILLAGAGFEAGLTGWEGYGSGTLTRVSPGHLSTYAAKLTGPSGTGEFGINDSPSLVTNAGALGTRIRISAWVQSDAGRGTARIRIREYNGGSNQQTVYSPVLVLSANWQQLVLEVVTKKAGSSIDLQVLDQPRVSGEMFLVDDVAIERVPAADRAPVVVAPATVTAVAGTPLAVDVTASDPDGQAITSLSASTFAATNPQTFTPGTGNTSGRLTWTPAAAEVGHTYTVTFTAQNAMVGTATTAITVVAAPPPSANLCGNGTFEVDTRGWGPYGSATLSRVSGGHGGSYALQIVGTASSSTFGCDDTPNWVATVGGVGAGYRFTAWVRSVSHRGSVRIRLYEFLGSTQQGSTAYSNVVTLSASWQKLTLDYTARTAGSTLSMRITDSPVSSSVAETFLVDDVAIEPLNVPSVSAQRPVVTDEAVTLEYARPVVYPNPARGGATLALSLAKAGGLRAELYDVAGRVVRVLADESQAAAGTHRFALERERGTKLGAGIYFYRAEVAGTAHRGRFVILE